MRYCHCQGSPGVTYTIVIQVNNGGKSKVSCDEAITDEAVERKSV